MQLENDNQPRENALYRALARAILLASGVVVAFWFFYQALLAVLFALVAFILAMALNPPVVWLAKHKVGRVWGTLLIVLLMLLLAAGLGALVVPRLAEQVASLIAKVPDYADRLNHQALQSLKNAPQLQHAVNQVFNSDLQLWSRITPLLQNLLMRVGGYTASLLGAIIFLFLMLMTVIYVLAQPEPLLKSYIGVFPPHLRDQAERAYRKSAAAISGWLWSNMILGVIEAVASGIALSLLGVPGALVWAALTFFGELVPQLGPIIMMGPPVLVALAISPMTALWVALFYLAMMQISGNVIAPLVRSKQMKLHPVSLLFSVLAMGSVFGVLGALIATPVTGIFKAFYDEFYAARQPADAQDETRVTRMLQEKLSLSAEK